MKRLLPLLTVPLLSGCVVATVAETAIAIAKVPVKIVSAGVDATTTSQSEADERRAREARRETKEAGEQP